jgi:hypothetical protein
MKENGRIPAVIIIIIIIFSGRDQGTDSAPEEGLEEQALTSLSYKS